MLSWIYENYRWLFSGIGAAPVSKLFHILYISLIKLLSKFDAKRSFRLADLDPGLHDIIKCIYSSMEGKDNRDNEFAKLGLDLLNMDKVDEATIIIMCISDNDKADKYLRIIFESILNSTKRKKKKDLLKLVKDDTLRNEMVKIYVKSEFERYKIKQAFRKPIDIPFPRNNIILDISNSKN